MDVRVCDCYMVGYGGKFTSKCFWSIVYISIQDHGVRLVALSDLYQVKHFQTFQGQECLNVYFYERSIGTGGAVELADDWQTAILPKVNDIQSTNVLNVRLDVANLGDAGDFDVLTLIDGGGLAAESLPAFNAVSYTFKPDTRAVRHGGKRYVGVPESVTVVNEITGTVYLASMETLRAALAAPIVGLANTWRPVLVKRIRSTVAGTVPPQYRYRLPIAGDTLVVAGMLSVLVSTHVKHQTSRQT
jgi:hypothetical protein